MPRLFIALWPPDEVTEELRALPRKDQRGVRFVPPDNWHVTLRFLGEADPDEVADAMRSAILPATHARLGPGVDVLHERALIVPVTGVDELAQLVRDRTEHIGEPARQRFFGHLTLARVKPRLPMPRALGMLLHAEWTVQEIALVQSHLRTDGAVYDTIDTWPVG